ncbi:MAG: deoxyguanosinetriphosphate triphosphohydrolase [Chloroflexi bacterium RBG_19FT_COMBO_47_15]|nr:MAG: deoxyguanosinetriphosphate triphosphohydrolase [Chloroflexi bacterium RBG_19FT_COMBO_47_15]
MNIRQRIEESENSLSSYAAKSRFSRGRLKWEEPCPIRTDFQRDRDRIIHSKAFRRLKHKTQVFIAPLGDHYVTRLTHTLEVSQIARTISRALNLNEDLTEAIALGHDLGHTPFGHVGEQILDELCPGGFKHNEQSLRVVDLLEKDGQGLNLTWEVRDGILNHSKSGIEILGEGWTDIGTIEGQVVKMADIVAYVNHDTADAIRAGVIAENELPDSAVRLLGHTSSQRINTLVSDIVSYSLAHMDDVNLTKPVIGINTEILEATNSLREFLFDKVYNPSLANEDTAKAQKLIRLLYSYLLKHEDTLPREYALRDDTVERKITDYIAGMTDQYALMMAKEISY